LVKVFSEESDNEPHHCNAASSLRDIPSHTQAGLGRHSRLLALRRGDGRFAKACQWIERDGRSFAVTPVSATDQIGPLSQANAPASPALGADAGAIEPSKSGEDAAKPPTVEIRLEEKMLLADIVFELQVLLSEAKLLVDPGAE
jgi:hypothetical protein